MHGKTQNETPAPKMADIPLLHLRTVPKQMMYASNYEYSDNSFVISIHKEKSHNHWGLQDLSISYIILEIRD